MSENEYKFTINNNSYSVEIRSIENEQAVVLVNGEEFVVDIESLPLLPSSNVVVKSPGAKVGPMLPMGFGMPVAGVASGEGAQTEDATYSASQKKSTALMRSAMKKKTEVQTKKVVIGNPVKSPLPGLILSIKVKVGDSVKAGDVVLIMEAMKMENDIRAHIDGSISQILVEIGQSVGEGDPLVGIA